MIWLVKLAPARPPPFDDQRWNDRPPTPKWWKWTRIHEDYGLLRGPTQFIEWVERCLEFGECEFYVRMDDHEKDWSGIPDDVRRAAEQYDDI